MKFFYEVSDIPVQTIVHVAKKLHISRLIMGRPGIALCCKCFEAMLFRKSLRSCLQTLISSHLMTNLDIKEIKDVVIVQKNDTKYGVVHRWKVGSNPHQNTWLLRLFFGICRGLFKFSQNKIIGS